MQYLEYIQTDGGCWFDTNIVPDINTKLEAYITPLSNSVNWNGFIGAQNADDDNSTFQIRRNSSNIRWAARVGNGSGNVGPNYTTGTTYHLTLDRSNFNVDGTDYSTGTGSMDTCNYSIFIGAIHNPNFSSSSPKYRAGYARFGEVLIYSNNVLVADLIPANNNGALGFYDRVSSVFRPNLGDGTPIAGPAVSSIIVYASKTVLATTGETINIVVTCENAWTVTGETFLTLSSTGDTGSTTITATAPSYTGTTARTDTLTFTDTVTGDEWEIAIRQKKYSAGQPVYLGDAEVTELYLGGNAVSEAYLGDVLVYSSGPFVGLKAIPSSISFNDSTLQKTVKVKSSEAWTMTLPSWISADVTSGSAGDTDVTLTATAQVAATTGTISLSSANYSASVNVSYEEVNYVDGIRMSAAPSWDAKYCLDTNVTVGGTDTTIRVKYYGCGVFSDRIVGTIAEGPEGNQGVNDNNDFRYFPTMADAGSNRINNLPKSLYANGVFQDITFGNLYVYNNQTSTMISQGTTNAPLSTATIRVDMSTNWIQEVIISKGGNVVYDGKAASIGSEYGLYDTIGGGFITDSNLNIVARQAS